MKYLFLAALVCVCLVSCRTTGMDDPNPPASDLTGKWRMVSVTDNLTNTTTIKPAGTNGDVDIDLVSTSQHKGSINGNTPTNTLIGEYTTGSKNSLSIPAIGATKVMETSWGFLFLDNITYTRQFSMDNINTLHISASTNKTLNFIRR